MRLKQINESKNTILDQIVKGLPVSFSLDPRHPLSNNHFIIHGIGTVILLNSSNSTDIIITIPPIIPSGMFKVEQYAGTPKNIQNIRNMIKYRLETPKEQLIIDEIKNGPSDIRYLEAPSENVQLAAVSSDYRTIDLIERPTIKVILTAMAQDPSVASLLSNPDFKITDRNGPKIIKIPSGTTINKRWRRFYD